jgi:uncharacterized protein YkwD
MRQPIFGLVILMISSPLLAKAPRSPYGERPVNNSFVSGSSLQKYAKKNKNVDPKSADQKNVDQISAVEKSSPAKTSCVELMGEAECQMFLLTNKAREARHLKPLKYFKNCYLSAQEHSQYMANMNNTGQGLGRSVNHDQFKERTKKFDVGNTRITENVAGGGFKKTEELFTHWMESSEHRANILDPKVNAMALAKVEDKDGLQFWTQCFSSIGNK